MWSKFFGELSNKFGLNNIIDATCALEIATFNRFLLKKNSLFLGKESLSDDVIEIIVTGASWPWNLSIVPTLGFLILDSSNFEINKLNPNDKLSKMLFSKNLVASTSEFKRLLKQNGVKLNGEILSEDISISKIKDGYEISLGKRTNIEINF